MKYIKYFCLFLVFLFLLSNAFAAEQPTPRSFFYMKYNAHFFDNIPAGKAFRIAAFGDRLGGVYNTPYWIKVVGVGEDSATFLISPFPDPDFYTARALRCGDVISVMAFSLRVGDSEWVNCGVMEAFGNRFYVGLSKVDVENKTVNFVVRFEVSDLTVGMYETAKADAEAVQPTPLQTSFKVKNSDFFVSFEQDITSTTDELIYGLRYGFAPNPNYADPKPNVGYKFSYPSVVVSLGKLETLKVAGGKKTVEFDVRGGKLSVTAEYNKDKGITFFSATGPPPEPLPEIIYLEGEAPSEEPKAEIESAAKEITGAADEIASAPAQQAVGQPTPKSFYYLKYNGHLFENVPVGKAYRIAAFFGTVYNTPYWIKVVSINSDKAKFLIAPFPDAYFYGIRRMRCGAGGLTIGELTEFVVAKGELLPVPCDEDQAYGNKFSVRVLDIDTATKTVNFAVYFTHSKNTVDLLLNTATVDAPDPVTELLVKQKTKQVIQLFAGNWGRTCSKDTDKYFASRNMIKDSDLFVLFEGCFGVGDNEAWVGLLYGHAPNFYDYDSYFEIVPFSYTGNNAKPLYIGKKNEFDVAGGKLSVELLSYDAAKNTITVNVSAPPAEPLPEIVGELPELPEEPSAPASNKCTYNSKEYECKPKANCTGNYEPKAGLCPQYKTGTKYVFDGKEYLGGDVQCCVEKETVPEQPSVPVSNKCTYSGKEYECKPKVSCTGASQPVAGYCSQYKAGVSYSFNGVSYDGGNVQCCVLKSSVEAPVSPETPEQPTGGTGGEAGGLYTEPSCEAASLTIQGEEAVKLTEPPGCSTCSTVQQCLACIDWKFITGLFK